MAAGTVVRAKSMPSYPKRTLIPAPGGSGLTPTGAMQFRDDWPGLFIRGDDVGRISSAIRRLQQHCSGQENWEVRNSLRVLNEIADIIEKDVIVSREELGEA